MDFVNVWRELVCIRSMLLRRPLLTVDCSALGMCLCRLLCIRYVFTVDSCASGVCVLWIAVFLDLCVLWIVVD